MEIKVFCAWWGLDHLGMEGMLNKIKGAGFDGVEVFAPIDPREREILKNLLEELELDLIIHQYRASGPFKEYSARFKAELELAASMSPLLINSHTGKDYWSMEENGRLIEIGFEVESNTGIKIAHETHRGRFPFCASVTKPYFDKYPDLRIAADLSHWVVVAESLLEGQEDVLDTAIKRTEHIHARVGFPEGPQISDPRLPEWKEEVAVFTGWWQRVVDRFIAEKRPYLTITPEFGPVPYTWTVPHTGMPVSDFFDINVYMKDYLKKVLVRK
jgi:sugar phosphate isomerase/epimerase